MKLSELVPANRFPTGIAIIAMLVFLLVYAVELGGFTLSIDEEIASIQSADAKAWLAQGRWGMALVTLVLPNFEAIPVLSTLLFGAGLVIATTTAVTHFRLEGGRAVAFAVMHVASPLWLHIAHFNTLAAGFGLGIAAAAVGAGLVVHGARTEQRSLAIVLLAFAMSVYQTLALYAVVYAVFALHARTVGARPGEWRAVAMRTLLAAAMFVVAAALYVVVQRGASSALEVAPAYVDVYWQGGQLLANPSAVLPVGLRAFGEYLSGRHPMYLGWEAVLLAPALLGMLPTWLPRTAAGTRVAHLGVFYATVACSLALVALPFLLSAGTLPTRAHVAWPLVVAWLASQTPWPARQGAHVTGAVILGYVVVVATSISASLFHTERLVRDADAALARALIPAIRAAAEPDPSQPIPFTVSGRWSFPTKGQLVRVGDFGASFFDHDQGNVYRMWLFMQTLGASGLQPLPLGTRQDLVPEAANMPAWPAEGSVRRVNGVVIVKLGPATPPQLAAP